MIVAYLDRPFYWVCFLIKVSNSSDIESSEAVARRSSANKGVLKSFAKFTGEHLCWSLDQIRRQLKKYPTFTEEILNGKLVFLYGDTSQQ